MDNLFGSPQTFVERMWMCGGTRWNNMNLNLQSSQDHPCTHNERIKRLWRDVTRSVGSIYYETFQNLEGSARFEPLNEIDIIFCLHWVYFPRLNDSLQQFAESWNHSLSSEQSLTPNQLYIEGTLAQKQSTSLYWTLLHSNHGSTWLYLTLLHSLIWLYSALLDTT